MPYEEDYKMWLEKMLIESNPDWVCDGMYDKEITRNWCVDYCGEDDEYITPKCLHMYYHHIERADRKTEPTISKMEQVDWKDQMWAEAVEDEPKTQMKTQNSNLTFEKTDEPQTEYPRCAINGTPFDECGFCEHFNCDTCKCEAQTERSE